MMHPLWEVYADSLKTRDDLTEPQRKVVLDVVSKVTKIAPTCGWNTAGDFMVSFALKGVYLDILIDKQGMSEWFFESDITTEVDGTKDKRASIPAAFWRRLAQVQE